MTGNLFASTDTPGEGWFVAHCDGGSRGNPGPSGYGAVIEDPQGRIAARLSKFLGIQTNNYAEYSGLLAVLNWAVETGTQRLRVISDSELMVKQMQGKYKVASPVLRPLFEQARSQSRKLERFEMRHTLRGGNQEADRLATKRWTRGWVNGQLSRAAGRRVSLRRGRMEGWKKRRCPLRRRQRSRPGRCSRATSRAGLCICLRANYRTEYS